MATTEPLVPKVQYTESARIPHSPPQLSTTGALFLNLLQTCPIWEASSKRRRIVTNLNPVILRIIFFISPEVKKPQVAAVGKTIYPREGWPSVLEHSSINSFHNFVCTGTHLLHSNNLKCFAKVSWQQVPQLNYTSHSGKSIFPVFPVVKVVTFTQHLFYLKENQIKGHVKTRVFSSLLTITNQLLFALMRALLVR